MVLISLIVALIGGFNPPAFASDSLLARHHDVWDNEWDDVSVEWESLLGRLLAAIQSRKFQDAHDLLAPMTGVLARINTLAQPAVRRNQEAAVRAVAAILVERSREVLLRYRFEERSDLDMLAVYLTQLANQTNYDAFKVTGHARVRTKRWEAGAINAGIFALIGGTGYGAMVLAFMAIHTHMWHTATPISMGVGALLGATVVRMFGRALPRGPRRSDKNVVERRLIDCRRMLDHY